MTLTNTVIVLDLAINGMIAFEKLQGLLRRAATEGRDVSDEELAALKAENDLREDRFLS